LEFAIPAVIEVGEVVKKRPNILLADDNAAILEVVSRLLRSHQCNVVAKINDGADVVRESLRLRPDIIVLDISMDTLNGIDLARELGLAGCSSKIIFLSVHEDSDFVNAAMGAGGSAYVVKSRVATDLCAAVDAVHEDKRFLSPTMLYQAGRS
jgi:DNA-binding NarL/FixJ family response regulator